MSSKLSLLRIVALTVATLIAAWLSFDSWKGVILFGNRIYGLTIHGLTMFFFIWFPPMAFPAAVVAWWKSGIAAILFALVIFGFFGALLVIFWPDVGAPARIMLRANWPFLVCEALLILVAFSGEGNKEQKSLSA
jgi:hypothetical protein